MNEQSGGHQRTVSRMPATHCPWRKRTPAPCRTLAVLLCAATVCSAGEEQRFDRQELEKWVETKRLISMERQDWRADKEVLGDRIALITREIENLKEMTKDAAGDIGEADKKLEELKTSNDELKAATAGLGDTVTGLERRVKAFLARAPVPISERVKPLSQRIPDNPAETRMSFSERFQNVIGVLNEVNKFAGEITEAVEVRTLLDGSRTEVTVLYLGLGQAFYSNQSSGLAGAGAPGEKGWIWEPHDEAAEEIGGMIAVFRNEKPAAFITVPIRINTTASSAADGHAE